MVERMFRSWNQVVREFRFLFEIGEERDLQSSMQFKVVGMVVSVRLFRQFQSFRENLVEFNFFKSLENILKRIILVRKLFNLERVLQDVCEYFKFWRFINVLQLQWWVAGYVQGTSIVGGEMILVKLFLLIYLNCYYVFGI